MIPASESVKLLTSSLKGMKLSANEAISVVDKLTKLDMKSATSAQELAQALSKVANSARLAKVSQDEILGVLSVGIETTQQSGDVIGTAVRSLLARFSNVKASRFGGSGEETEGTLNDTEAVLSKIGIRIRNASGEMRSFMDVLDDVAEKWDTLDDVSRNAISTAMAGTRQKEIFASIIENYDRVKELTEESANAAGTADEKYTAYMDSMEAATKRLQNAWEGFTQSLETSTVIKGLTNATAVLVENADKLKYFITIIAAASSAKIFDFFTNKGETGGLKGLMEEYGKLLKQRNIQNPIMGATSAVITNLLTTKQVGGGWGKLINKTDQTVEETAGGKALRTVFSGGLAALGGKFGPFGAMLGQVLGENFAGMLSTWFHRDELAMKQRVADAKENLSALNNIHSALENNTDVLSKYEYESSDYKKLEELVNSLRNNFAENQSLGKSFLEDINKVNVGKFITIEEVLQKVKEGNVEINKAISQQLELTTARLKVENTFSSQEEEREKVNKRIRTEAFKAYAIDELFYEELEEKGKLKIEKQELPQLGRYSPRIYKVRLNGGTIDEQLENAEEVLNKARIEGKAAGVIQKWEKIVDDYRVNADKLHKLNSELLDQQVDYAMLSTDITNKYSRDDIRKMGMEGVVGEIRNELIAQGVGVVDEKGIIHKDAYDAIVRAIRSDSTLSEYISKDIRSIGELISKEDTQGIEAFARAFGLTADAARDLGKQFGYLTQSMGLMNVQETTEYYDKLGTVFSNLSSNVALTAEQINSLLTTSELKDLLPYLTNQDSDALIEELYKRIYGGGQDIHMENALYDATMGMSVDKLREYLQGEGFNDFVTDIDKAGYTTLSQVRDWIKELDKDDERREKFLKYLETINYTYSKDLTALEKPSEYIKSQLTDQINNLQEQKDALSQINDEREKELSLIKAKQALEDARKEKRRVYRAGVGFVMESNEEAIAEAQKNLENLNTQKRQEDIQTQIDALQMQKDIVEALPNQAQLEQTKKIWELWAADKGVKGSLASVTESVTMLADAYTNATNQMNMRTKTQEALDTPEEKDEMQTSEERTDPTIKLNEDQIKNIQALVPDVRDIKNYPLYGEKPQAKTRAIGDTSFQGGAALINELGTEAVITPGGTLTALPSKTGIVPADITRNVWALGEIAPTLVARLSSLSQKALAGNAGNTTYEEGQYFDNFTMNVYPAKGDDFNKILEQARTQMRLTRHNN